MKRISVPWGVSLLCMTLAVPALSADYDLVIDNGQVMDSGTMYNAVANIGINGGKIAVITLFDPKTVTDNATHKAGENGLPSTGIPYVIVNGAIMVKESKVLPVKPGQPIRYPVEDKGRFVLIDVNKWLVEHTISVPLLPHVDDNGAGAIHKY